MKPPVGIWGVVIGILLLSAHGMAGSHTDAMTTANLIDKAIKTQTLPYDRELTMTQLAQLGYNTSAMSRPGTYRVIIKSVTYDASTGSLQLYLNAWHNGTSLAIRNPVNFYMPMTISGSNNAQRLTTFIKMLVSYFEIVPYGAPQNDDTWIYYPTDDGYAQEDTDASWQTVRDAAGDSATRNQTGTQTVRNLVTTASAPTVSSEARGIFSFNTSSLPDDCTVDSWILSIQSNGADMSGNGVPNIRVTGGTLSNNTTIATTDYDSYSSTYLSDTAIAQNAWATINNFTGNAAGLSYVSKISFTVLYVRDHWDVDNSFGGTLVNSAQNYWSFYPVGYATAENRPRLIITFTNASTSAPVAAFSGNVTSGYPPFSVLFTDASTNTPTSWSWLFGDGKNSTSQNPTNAYNSSIGNTVTTYDVNLTATNAAGSDSENKSAYITAYPLLANFSMNTTSGCAPLSVAFNDTTTNGTPTAWSWNFGGLSNSSIQNTSYTFTTPGTYYVSLNASNTYSWDIENKTTAINVTGSVPAAAYTANTTSGCIPLSIAFTDSSTGTPTNWTWDFNNDGNPDSYNQNPTYSFNASGLYTVNLTVSNGCGSDTETKVDYINASDCVGPPTAAFSANVTSGCPTLSVLFTDASIGNVTNWSWDVNNDGTPDAFTQNYTAAYGVVGSYSVNLTVTGPGGSDSEVKNNYITVVDPAITADFTADDTTPTTAQIVAFTDLSTDTPNNWTWDFNNDGNPDSFLQNPTYTFTTAGIYTVNLTVLNACGGNDTETKVDYITVVNVTPTPTPTPANFTTGNATYIYGENQDYCPWQIWLSLVIVVIGLFTHSFVFTRNTDLTAAIAAVLGFVVAWLSNMIGWIDIGVVTDGTDLFIIPTIKSAHPPWLVYVMLMFAFTALLNIFWQIYKIYLKPKDWNEIYNRRIGKY